MTPPKRTVSRPKLEARLAEVRDELVRIDETRAPLVAERDDLVRRLRKLEDPPSLRRLAELSGLSNPRVSHLEHAPG